MLLAQGVDELLGPVGLALGHARKFTFQTGNGLQVLLLFQEHAVTLQICIFYALAGLLGKLEDLLFFFFVERNFGLLLF